MLWILQILHTLTFFSISIFGRCKSTPKARWFIVDLPAETLWIFRCEWGPGNPLWTKHSNSSNSSPFMEFTLIQRDNVPAVSSYKSELSNLLAPEWKNTVIPATESKWEIEIQNKGPFTQRYCLHFTTLSHFFPASQISNSRQKKKKKKKHQRHRREWTFFYIGIRAMEWRSHMVFDVEFHVDIYEGLIPHRNVYVMTLSRVYWNGAYMACAG